MSTQSPYQQLAEGLRVTAERSMFVEEPPSFADFVSSKKYLGQPPLFKLQEQIVVEAFGTNPELYFSDEKKHNVLVWMSGKSCKIGSSEVYDAISGQFRRIDSLTNEHNFYTNGLNTETRSINQYKATNSWVSGTGPCYRVTTSYGFVTEVYEGHQFYACLNRNTNPSASRQKFGWKELRELQVGDRIGVTTKLTCDNPVRLDGHIIELVALLIGDGTLGGEKVHLTCHENSVETRDAFISSVNKIPGMEVRVVSKSKNHPNVLRLVAKRIGTGSSRSSLRTILRDLDLLDKTSYTKRIPKQFFSLPDDQIALFLSRLYATDGWVYSNGKNKQEIGYCSVSKDLAQDVQRLLLRLGIIGKLRQKKTSHTYKGVRKESVAYCVDITHTAMLRRFCEQIRILDKWDAQDRLIAANERIDHTRFNHGDVYWDKIKSIEYIGEHDYYDIEVEDVQNYVSDGAFIDHNSGKDLLVSYLIAYFTYLLLIMRNPRQQLGMPPGEALDVITVASNQKQANDVLFTKITNCLRKPCMQRFTPIINTADARFPQGIRIWSLHSRGESWEGYNPVMWVMAEASAFEDSSGKSNAEAVLRILRSSAVSRYKKKWTGFVTSYPRSDGDFIMRLYDRAKDLPDHYRKKSATWEARDDRTRADYDEEFNTDPEFASTAYACEPSAGLGKWFNDQKSVKSAFINTLEPEVDWEPDTIERDVDGEVMTFRNVEILSYAKVQNAQYVAHGDPGLKRDGFCFVIGRLGKEFNQELQIPMVEIVAIIEWVPDPTKNIKVNFLNVRDVIDELNKEFGFLQVTFDQWNSAMLIQDLIDRGVNAKDKSFSAPMQTSMYKNLRSLVNNRMIRILPYKKSYNEMRQMLNVGTKPDHPSTGTKDITDGVAAVSFYLTNGLVVYDPDVGKPQTSKTMDAQSVFAGM